MLEEVLSLGTTGALTPPQPPRATDSESDRIKEALLFAQQLADHEIESIKRLHDRTLKALGYLGAGVLVVGGFIGFIGYVNLKDAAIAATQAQMQKEVTKQVQEKLTQENVNQVVRDQLKSYSESALSAEIHRELTTPPLSTSIREAADSEAQQLINRQQAPRRFTSAQSKAFVDALSAQPELFEYPVAVTSAFQIGEPADYASGIRQSLMRSKVKVIESAMFDAPPIEAGVGIYYPEGKSGEGLARLLQASLQTAGVKAQLVPGKWSNMSGQPTAVTPLEIFVGSKPR
jgi:hypothetical protein